MALRQPGSQTSLRDANRAAVLNAVKRFGGLTQVELIEATGLSAATVSTIVKQLASSGNVKVEPTSRSGRRATLVSLALSAGLAAAVDIGPRELRIVLSNLGNESVAEQTMPLPFEHRVDTTLDRVALLIVDMLEQVGGRLADLVGIGVGIPAPIDPQGGTVSVPGLMRDWDQENIAEVMSRRLGRPVYVDKAANLGALGEALHGAARGFADAIFVLASHSVSAGIVLGGRVHRGFAGTAGEIGHVQVDPAGAICRCGMRGCLDTVVSATALTRPLMATHPGLTLRDLLALASAGDVGCSRVLGDAGEVIGGVLAATSQVLNPQVVVVGGELAQAGEAFLDPMRRELRRNMLANVVASVDVVGADLADRSVTTGAVAMVLERTNVTGFGGEG